MGQTITTFKLDDRIRDSVLAEAKDEGRSLSSLLRVLIGEGMAQRRMEKTTVQKELAELRELTDKLVAYMDREEDPTDAS